MPDLTNPISKAKHPVPLDFIKAARTRWSFPNWQARGDDSVYYNMHIPELLHCGVAAPVLETRALERATDPRLDTLAFTAGYKIAMTGAYEDELKKIDGDWLISRRMTTVEGLPQEPGYPMLAADPEVAEIVQPLLDAWQRLSEKAM